ncbi:MAG: hypothetical protein SXA11_22640 [Cyanobacteriota bacterium]|nr:hypothetical protein [Cyanobacteriota bacterium]
MLGIFQKSHLRIEIQASEASLRDSLLRPAQLKQWLWPERFSTGLPERLEPGIKFTSWLGPVEVQHYVDRAESNCLRLLLSKGVDGFHEWYWGDGWIQSRIEGVSALPLNLGQTLTLFRLRQFLAADKKPD